LRILVVKLNHLGDTLLMTPALRLLRQRFPGAWIDVVVREGCQAVLEGNPDVSQVITVPGLRAALTVLRRRYAYAFDLSNSDRAKVLVLLSGATVRGINARHDVAGWRKEVFNRHSYFDWGPAHQVLRDFRTVADVIGAPEAVPGPLVFDTSVEVDTPPPPYAVIHPASRWKFKQWLPGHWAAVADYLGSRGLKVVLSSGPGEDTGDIQSSAIHSRTEGRMSLRQLGQLIRRARLFLGVDTVALHIAAAVQTPSVALFGPSAEWSWHPWQAPHQLVLGECPCKASRKFTCDKSRPYPCMEGITVEAVTAAADKLLR
jgi:heptosyltransferase-3